MDYALTFAILLYFNIFYFAVYAIFEFCMLMFKAFTITETYKSNVLINEIAILAFMTVIESVRLMIGQSHSKNDFGKNFSSVFRILVLTVPSMYSVVYFTLWQAQVTRMEVCLGAIMLVVQASQLFSSFFLIFIQFLAKYKNGRYSRVDQSF